MSGLHKFKLKKIGLLLAFVIFYIVLTSLHVSAAGFQNTTSPGSIKDTNPKTKTVNRVNPAVGREQPVIERQQTTNGQPATNVATDTIPPRQDDSLVTTSRADTFSLKVAKDTMDAPVEYQAEDSAVLLVKEQKFILYGKTQTKYKTVTIDAPVTILDQETNILTAMSEKDSLGRMVTRAKFQDKEQVFESELFTYNFKTQKGITTNTFTKEGDFFVKANNAKKIDERTVFIREGYFTTCSYDDPHFAFKANKLKVISNSMAISGPTHPEFEGVPIPIYLPFGIFPLSQGRHSGFMAPQFTANQQFGLGLENFGYYHVLNDYVDVTMRASIYSYGGYNINITPQYRKRYRYNGLFNLSYNRTKFNFKGDPDYQVIKAFQINWSHSMDSKADPGVSFSANVNAGSTRFNEFLPNSPMRNFQNQLYSSITYSKTWKDKPFSLQLSANHNQNNTSRLINVILPDAGFTVSTLYPLQRKELVGTAKWYEKIGVGYNLVTRNQVSFYDTGQVSFRKILDTMQWGAQHRFPINIQLPPMGNFFVNPFISYEETWYTRRLSRTWNDALKKVDTVSIRKGIFTDRQLSFGLSFNTNVYGTFNFGKNSKIRAIRHVIRPTLSFNYKPNISRRSFDVIQTDASGRKLALPQFEGNMFPSYSYGRYGGITFGVDNNLEMKVRGKKDTADRKVRLIDGFGFSSGYNFLQDSLKLQPFSLYLRSTLFEKISISAQAQLDPYDVDPTTGQSLNRFVWANGRFTPGRITSGSISASTSFQSKPKDENKAKEDPRNKITDPTLLADQQRLMDYMQRNPAEFVDFNIAWSLNLSFSLAFNRTIKPDYSGYVTNISSSANFNSSFNLTPKWNFSTNGFYDFNTKQLQMFTMSISRDMHCWQMSIGVTPIGLYQYFNITISPKSSILKDLRVNRTRQFYNY